MNVLEVLVQQLNDKTMQLSEALASGRVDTFDEYRKVCGEIRGLLTARQYALDLKQLMEKSDD
jgi:hypothetical protein